MGQFIEEKHSMQPTAAGTWAIAVLAATALSACGGGGEGSEATKADAAGQSQTASQESADALLDPLAAQSNKEAKVVRQVYVNGTPGPRDANGIQIPRVEDGTTPATAWRTVFSAWLNAKPGDVINVMPMPNNQPYFALWLPGGKAHPEWTRNRRIQGTVDNHITIRGSGTGNNRTRVSGDFRAWFDTTWNAKGVPASQSKMGVHVLDGANYVNIENLVVTAPGNSGKRNAAGDYLTTGSGLSAIYFEDSHHIGAKFNTAFDSGCHGIGARNGDYVSIYDNVVFGNATDTSNGPTTGQIDPATGKPYSRIYCSGISLYQPLAVDGATGTKMWIMKNTVYGNTNQKPTDTDPTTPTNGTRNTDGSGIILDDFQRTQAWNSGAYPGPQYAYKGHTLIENNVIYDNGGRGVHVFYSDNVLIRSNTVRRNMTDPRGSGWNSGEIMAVQSSGVHVFSNAISTSGEYTYFPNPNGGPFLAGVGHRTPLTFANCKPGGKPNAFNNNVHFNLATGPNAKPWRVEDAGGHCTFVSPPEQATVRTGNPNFVNATTGPNADFHITAGSSARAYPTPSGTYSAVDKDGQARPATAISAGAYQ